MCGQEPFSEQKQLEAKVKVEETDPIWSQILFFLETGLAWKCKSSWNFSSSFVLILSSDLRQANP